MLIVLEGCDGSGKTTLANKLSAILNAEIIHCTTDTPNTLWFFRDILEMSKTKNIIADRFCYGQFVYQSPEERQLNEYDLYHLELTMMNIGARVIYVECEPEIIEERLTRRSEKPMKPINEIIRSYAKVFSNSILPILVADTSKPELGLLPMWKEGVKKRYGC